MLIEDCQGLGDLLYLCQCLSLSVFQSWPSWAILQSDHHLVAYVKWISVQFLVDSFHTTFQMVSGDLNRMAKHRKGMKKMKYPVSNSLWNRAEAFGLGSMLTGNVPTHTVPIVWMDFGFQCFRSDMVSLNLK